MSTVPYFHRQQSHIHRANSDKLTGRCPLYHAPIDNRVIYIEKLLGRKAAAEMYIPVLSKRKAKVRRATDAP